MKFIIATISLMFLIVLIENTQSALADDDPAFIHQDTFISAHPDLYWQRQGIRDYERGRYGEAMTAFRRAARYADKASQAMIAQILWNGDGVKADRVMAYVWADLAAERGYPDFIVTREKFWRELNADERRAAVSVGQAIFDEYGDVVAKKREENALRLARLNITGSRTGRVGTIAIQQKLPSGDLSTPVDGSLYYADKYWKPEQYWQWKDRVWTDPPEGKVEVGPIQNPPEH